VMVRFGVHRADQHPFFGNLQQGDWSLGKWVSKQRFVSEMLSEERRTKLSSIGFKI